MSHLGSACLRRCNTSQKAAFQQRQSDGTFVPADKTWSDYGSKQIENLAKDLKVSRADLYFCIQFAKKYPEISNALENLTWREIIKLLPAPKPENIEIP
jgi:hypothetical protein